MSLQTTYGIEVSFVTHDVNEGWYVEMNGQRAFEIDRYRNDAANTIIGMTSGEFEEQVLRVLDET